MKNWTKGHIFVLWLAGGFAVLVTNAILLYLHDQYLYTNAQLTRIRFWRLVGYSILGFALLGITWRWLSVRGQGGNDTG